MSLKLGGGAVRAVRSGHQLSQSVERVRNVPWMKSVHRNRKESSQMFGGEVSRIAEHRRSLFELISSKGSAGVRTEMALASGELII